MGKSKKQRTTASSFAAAPMSQLLLPQMLPHMMPGMMPAIPPGVQGVPSAQIPPQESTSSESESSNANADKLLRCQEFQGVYRKIVVRGNYYRKRNGNDVFDTSRKIWTASWREQFDPQWLELATVRKKGKQELPHMLQMSQNQPQLALGWETQSVLDIEFVAIVGLKLVAEHAAGS